MPEHKTSSNWRDAVPELPQRFATTLVRPNRKLVAALHQELRGGGKPELALEQLKAHVVQVIVKKTGERVGSLPPEDARLISDLEVDAARYHPHILEVHFTPRGRLEEIVVDLVYEASEGETAPVRLHDLLDESTREVAGEKPAL